VGLLAAGIFGYRDPRTLDYAKHLGIAFQLTNIIRDVGEDARKNRVYLPMEDLKRFGVPAADLLQARESSAFRSLMAFEAERARSYYQRALAALPAAGRRARRIQSQGQELDNGQHSLIGAYASLYQLMRTVGVPGEALLRLPLEIRYVRDFHLRRRVLGLAAALLAARGIALAERIAAVRFVGRLRRARFRLARDLSVAELLAQHRQHGGIAHFLWRPLCVSALNAPPVLASANVFLAVLRETLGGAPEASDLLLPRVDLSRLFPEPAAEFVRSRGGEIRLQSPVKDLGALRQSFDRVIVAVGPH